MSQSSTTPCATPRIWALIPAAGVGLRALSAQQRSAANAANAASAAQGGAACLPKQYQPLLGRSLLSHTLRAFTQSDAIAHTVVVIAPHDEVFASQRENAQPRSSAHAVGGASRAESVRNGLHALRTHHGAQACDWVLVHDAARCLITTAWVEQLIAAAAADAVGGLLALPLPDTLKQQAPEAGSARAATTIARGDKWLAHTPQMFRIGALQTALAGDDLSAITDEASAIEATGQRPLLVPSSAQNIKVTYPEDFALAEAILQLRQSQSNQAGQGLPSAIA